MKIAKGKGAARTEKKEVSLPVEDRKIGKRKAALKATESSKKRATKEKITKKDPNKPKRPPSSFFVFLEEFRKIYKQEHPNMKAVSAVGKAGGEKWKSMSAANTLTRTTVRILFVKVLQKPGTVAPTGPGRAPRTCSMTLELCLVNHTNAGVEKAPYEAKAAKKKSDYGKLMTAYSKKQETDGGGADEEDDHKHSHRSKSEVDGQDDSDESVGIIVIKSNRSCAKKWDKMLVIALSLKGINSRASVVATTRTIFTHLCNCDFGLKKIPNFSNRIMEDDFHFDFGLQEKPTAQI
ncbi:hypothetical protein POTOM_029478 [Populus tomentosa]|uniref:HMG box domain-containing protein n=1 Tax=Populus tomentosa TaxID=118781 RepID=A0A8X7ZAA5_POPTO|nr:hypothetical protein POTOM_029478 [Populus tomentosa]